MYKNAHKCFSSGICALLTMIFGFTPLSVTLHALTGYAVGALPDSDQKIPFVKHRGFTHSPIFAFLIALPLSLVLLYAGWAINLATGMRLFTVDITETAGIYIPNGIVAFFTGRLLVYLSDPLTLSFFAIFISLSFHIILDIITPSGVKLFGKKLYGGILSKDIRINKFFVVVGSSMATLSIIISIIRSFISITVIEFILFGVAVLFISLIFLLSLYRRNSRFEKRMKCYTVDGESFCTMNRCTEVKGEKICVREKRK